MLAAAVVAAAVAAVVAAAVAAAAAAAAAAGLLALPYIHATHLTAQTHRPDDSMHATIFSSRIAKAIRHRERFRVVIVTNAHPEGDIDSGAVRQITNYIYNSLCRGPNSLRGRLYENFGHGDVDRCLGLYCLQQSDTIRGRPVAHQVYIHAKLMIIDDRMAHIGSANINDRSFVGERDSELNVLVEDTHSIRGRQNGAFGGSAARDGGQPGRNMRAFRMRLWNQHLGLARDDQSTVDPLSATSYDLWTKTAKHNSSVMLEHFPAMPHSHHTSRSQQKQDAVAKVCWPFLVTVGCSLVHVESCFFHKL